MGLSCEEWQRKTRSLRVSVMGVSPNAGGWSDYTTETRRKCNFLHNNNYLRAVLYVNTPDYPHPVSAGTNPLPDKYHQGGHRDIHWHTANTAPPRGIGCIPLLNEFMWIILRVRYLPVERVFICIRKKINRHNRILRNAIFKPDEWTIIFEVEKGHLPKTVHLQKVGPLRVMWRHWHSLQDNPGNRAYSADQYNHDHIELYKTTVY